MTYEVELKFPLVDTGTILEKIAQLGATAGKPLEQRDVYYSHPSRDFAQTDEALRIRSSAGGQVITYKGPIVDSQTKMRKEIEIPFGATAGDATRLDELLTELGFRKVRSVVKMRAPFALEWEGRQIELVVDEVEDLGTFLEIETMADERTRSQARDCILHLAQHLGLEHPERRSYLVMLLEQHPA